MRSATTFAAALIALAAMPAWAQEHQHDQRQAAPSPYAGLQQRDIKALSDEEIRKYREGEGMGFALAAELNHYPGPRHALEMADHLGLSAAQRATIVRAREAMQQDARRHGEAIVAMERDLDRGFASGAMDSTRLRAHTAEIARLQGELRFVHLAAHLAVRASLTPEQVARYDAMRGY